MTESSKFSKEFVIYILGEFFSKSLLFILLPIYTSYLSLEDFSIVSLITVIWPLLIILFGVGFSTFIIRGMYEYKDQKTFLSTVFAFAMTVALVVGFLIHYFGDFLFPLFFKDLNYKPYLQYAVFFAFFRLFYNHVLSVYRAKRQPLTVVILSSCIFVANLIAVLYSIYILHSDLLGILNAQLYAFIFLGILFFIKLWPELHFKIDLKIIWPSLLFVLPLVPHALSGWVLPNASRVFIQRYMSPVDLSVYHVAGQLAMILAILNFGLNQAWIPFVYANYKRSDFLELFSNNARKVVIFSTLVAAAIIIFSKELVCIMGKVEYLQACSILPIITIGFIFQIFYLVYVSVIIYNKKTKLMPFISVTAGIVCLGLNYLLVPRIGMYGAAAGTLLSFLLMSLLAKYFSNKFVEIRILDKKIYYFFFMAVLIVYFSFYLNINSFIISILIKLVLMVLLFGALILLKLFRPIDFVKLFVLRKN